MALTRVLNIGGINTFVNPLLKNEAELLRAVNVESYPYGAKRKRAGYSTFLGTADGSAVTDLFSWTKNDGTTLFLYRVSGGKIYYSQQGTGAWTVAGNGTVSGEHVGHAILDDTLIVGDGVGSTRHTTNGTAFTNTTLAPVASHFAQYQNRIYASGTSSTLFYSTTGNAADWATGGTSDSSSLTIPGGGKLGKIFVVADRLTATKNSGAMFRWDGYSLVDLATREGPSSPYSVKTHEGFFFYLNNNGINGYGGDRPELLSNAIQSQIYNDANTGISGGQLGTAPAETFKTQYLLSAGTVTDDITNETIDDAVIVFDYQKNEFYNYQYNNFPLSWHSFQNASGEDKLIFGSTGGQVYQIDGTKNADNGVAIPVLMEFVITMGVPEVDKEWKQLWMYFNPGNQAKVQIAASDSFRRDGLKWLEMGDNGDGTKLFRDFNGSRSKMLFVRIYESSKNSRFKFYGMSIEAEGVPYSK